MSTIQCPFCGEEMNSPLRFCLGCGRAVTPDDIQKGGLRIHKTSETKRQEGNGSRGFTVSRKEYSTHRQMRVFFYTSSLIIAACFAYYVTMHYVLHEPIPGHVDVMLERLLGGQQAQSNAPSQPPAATAGSTEGR